MAAMINVSKPNWDKIVDFFDNFFLKSWSKVSLPYLLPGFLPLIPSNGNIAWTPAHRFVVIGKDSISGTLWHLYLPRCSQSISGHLKVIQTLHLYFGSPVDFFFSGRLTRMIMMMVGALCWTWNASPRAWSLSSWSLCRAYFKTAA